jgi:hypothetical protein
MASDENLRGSEPLNHLSRRQTLTLPGHGSAWNVTLGHITLSASRVDGSIRPEGRTARTRNLGSESVGLEKARLRAHSRGDAEA